MNDLNKKCEKLIQVSKFKNESDYDEYTELIEKLSKYKNNKDVLKCFLNAFNEIDAGEIQYELIEACEEFDDKVYIPIFLEYGKMLFHKAPTWFNIMFQSILNTKSCLSELYKIFPSLPNDEKQFYSEIIKSISKEESKYKKILLKIEEL